MLYYMGYLSRLCYQKGSVFAFKFLFCFFFCQRRICMILIHIITPYVLHKLIDWVEKWLKSPIRHDQVPQATKDFLLKCIPAVRQTITFLHRCHLALFYFNGVFYHIAKRLSSVNYVRFRHIYTVEVWLIFLWIFGVLMPLSAIFQLYHGDKFQWWKKPE